MCFAAFPAILKLTPNPCPSTLHAPPLDFWFLSYFYTFLLGMCCLIRVAENESNTKDAFLVCLRVKSHVVFVLSENPIHALSSPLSQGDRQDHHFSGARVMARVSGFSVNKPNQVHTVTESHTHVYSANCKHRDQRQYPYSLSNPSSSIIAEVFVARKSAYEQEQSCVNYSVCIFLVNPTSFLASSVHSSTAGEQVKR